jgi:hypothetical protein
MIEFIGLCKIFSFSILQLIIISVYSQFVEACFGPFSAQLAKVGPYRALEKEAQDLIGALHEKLERRRRDLQTGLGVGVRSKIKLTTVELKVCLHHPFLY